MSKYGFTHFNVICKACSSNEVVVKIGNCEFPESPISLVCIRCGKKEYDE